MTAAALPLRFQIGARTLLTVRRRLARAPLSLADALAGCLPALPPLEPGADGYAITSLPVERLAEIRTDAHLAYVRNQYTRYYVDLALGFETWSAQLSANARSAIKRKAKRLAAASGGALDIRRFTAPDEIAAFLPEARALSERTYQHRLLGAGLPDSPAFTRDALGRAAAGEVRGWLLWVEDRAVAYLFCTAQDGDLRYDYVGHDPAFADLSPGSVLQAEVLRDLMAERRFARFDFLEGEGRHKRQYASGGVACCDLLLLRPTLANRALVAALAGFDAAVTASKRLPALRKLASKIRR